jgi:hypothetical protein
VASDQGTDGEATQRAFRAFRAIDTAPATVHEVITRQKVDDLALKVGEVKAELSGEMSEIRMRINGLIFVVIAAVVVQIVGRAGGWL